MGDTRPNSDRIYEKAEADNDKALPEPVEKAVQELGNLKDLSRAFYSSDKDEDGTLTLQELKDRKRESKDPDDLAAVDYAIKNFDKLSNKDGSISKDDIANRVRSVAEAAILSLAKGGAEELQNADLYKLGGGMPRDQKETEKYVADLNKKLTDAGIKDVKIVARYDVELPSGGIGGGTDNILYLEKNGARVPVARQAEMRLRC